MSLADLYFAAHRGPWAIWPPAADRLVAALGAVDLAGMRAVAAEPAAAREPDTPRYRTIDGLAVLDVLGPIVRHATPMDAMLASMLGGTTIDWLREGLDRALRDRSRGIVLYVDSPGGEVTGVGETAAMIREASRRKPVVAYVHGIGASAAYYLASAAEAIVAGPSSLSGSIGAVLTVVDDAEYLRARGIKKYTYVSTQSPRKRPEPGTEAGDAQFLEVVDSVMDVFRDDVAAYRGTSPLRVVEDFGQGDVLIASEARKVGLVDHIGDWRRAARAVDDLRRSRTRSAAVAAGSSVSSPASLVLAANKSGVQT